VLRAEKLLDDADTLLFWALACVTSRAFEAADGNVMVPLLDLFDHARPRETAYEYHAQLPQLSPSAANGSNRNTLTGKPRSTGGGFLLTALKRVEPGVEVHDTYGAKGCAHLLLHYGFVVRFSPFFFI